MAKFIWLRDSAFPRTGPRLLKGKEHDAEAYPAAVVAEWIKTGAAKEVSEPIAEKKDKAAKHSGGR
jgi:hypothetical protein